MKTIFLVRHAKSSWNVDGIADIERHLNERGYDDAHDMASRLKKKSGPGLIITSPAIRAYSTALIFARSLGVDPALIRLHPLLYDTTVKQYLSVIASLPEEQPLVYLFGHNPVITETANMLGGTELADLPTAGIVGIESEEQTWKEMVDMSGRMIFYDYPKNDAG